MAPGKDRIQRLIAKQFANQTTNTFTANTEFVGPQITLDGATPIILSGTAVSKGINFASVTPAHADADDAFIAIGTWNDAKVITTQAYHFVPIQVNLESGTSVNADIAAARFRVNTSASTANTLTNVNVLEMRSKLQVAVGSHANLQVSTEVSENIACTGDLLVGYFSLQGDGVITCSNHVNVLEATCVMSSGASGVDNVAHFTMNSTGVTATNGLKVEAIAGTLTNLAYLANTGGTVTNGLYIDGTLSSAIKAGASSSSPIITTSTGTTNMVEINSKLNAASGIIRGLLAYTEFSGTQVATTVNCYSIRGYAKISGTLTSGNGYAAGVQGKIEISGTLGSGARVAGVLAQINSSAGTLSAGGEIMGLWVDSQLTTKGSATVNMVAIQNTVADVVVDNFVWIFGRGTSAFKFDTNDGSAKDYLQYASTAPAAATGSIAINVNGATRYILITDDPTA